jgi:ethanolamine utilization protein EutQ (cupin superfamily)
VDSRLVEGLMRKFMNQKSGLRKFADSCTYSVTTEKLGPSQESGSETMAHRFNSGKPDLVYLLDFPEAIRELTEVAEYVANKYSKHNWKKGLKVRSVASSLLRHLAAYIDGEDVDEESGLFHTGAIVWNAMVLAEMSKRYDMDDRDRSVE